MVTNLPDITYADLDKIALANYPNDGDAIKYWYPPFFLDKKVSGSAFDGMAAVVAYRSDNEFSYNMRGIPIITKTLKFAAIPSIIDGLQITKDGTSGVSVSAGNVRYLNSAKEWKEVATPLQAIGIGVPPPSNPTDPPAAVETLYVVVYDLETSPKLDVFKPDISLFDAAPNAATVDPAEPAIIIGRVDIDGDGDVIAIFNDGIHAGLESQKAEDLREQIGVIQHNIEPVIDASTSALSFTDLPDRYIIGYTNFGKARPDNRFPYIGAMIDDNPAPVETMLIDSKGAVIIPSSLSIASQELEKYTADSNPAGTPLKRDEFVLHPIFVYLDLDSSPALKYAIVRSAVVLRKRPLNPLPLEKQIKKYMLEETLGGTEVPQFVTDFCTLCGFFVVDDTMNLRTTIDDAFIIPATEGFSSIHDRPSSISAPHTEDSGLLVVKEGDGAKAVGIPVSGDGAIYKKTSKGITAVPQGVNKWCRIIISKEYNTGGQATIKGYNQDGAINAAALQKILTSSKISVTPYVSGVWYYTINSSALTATLRDDVNNSDLIEEVRIIFGSDNDFFKELFAPVSGTGTDISAHDIDNKSVHANCTLSINLHNPKQPDIKRNMQWSFIDSVFQAGMESSGMYTLNVGGTPPISYNFAYNIIIPQVDTVYFKSATVVDLGVYYTELHLELDTELPRYRTRDITSLPPYIYNRYSGLRTKAIKRANDMPSSYTDSYLSIYSLFMQTTESVLLPKSDLTNRAVAWGSAQPYPINVVKAGYDQDNTYTKGIWKVSSSTDSEEVKINNYDILSNGYLFKDAGTNFSAECVFELYLSS